MQWIALDDIHPITAVEGVKKKKYKCPECGSFVQLRSGPHRQAHFYHLRCPSKCQQHKKTEEHLGLQILIASSMSSNEMRMERPFPEINRIADVAWEERKILFEIQCSPISEKEAFNRNKDYHSIGWNVIWVLSDKKFNKRKLSASEAFLRGQTCYYSHWPRRQIYDQCEVLKGFFRIYKGPKIEIEPLKILSHAPLACAALPPSLQQRWNNWKLRTEGDILSQLHANPKDLTQTLQAIEERLTKQAGSLPPMPLSDLLKKGYLLVLNKILRLFTQESL